MRKIIILMLRFKSVIFICTKIWYLSRSTFTYILMMMMLHRALVILLLLMLLLKLYMLYH